MNIYAIHFICDSGSQYPFNWKNLTRPDKKLPTYESGNWDTTSEVAKKLVGGWIYLHKTKADLSEFGGKIQGYRIVQDDSFGHPKRIVFTFAPTLEGKSQKWRGNDFGMAHSSGLVEANYEHELAK